MTRIGSTLLAMIISAAAWAGPSGHPGPVVGGVFGKTKVSAMKGLEKAIDGKTKFNRATFTPNGPNQWTAIAVAKLPKGSLMMPIIMRATIAKTGDAFGFGKYEAKPLSASPLDTAGRPTTGKG